MMKKQVYHTLKPIYDKNSKILILGSMPSIKSKELNFYYMHPQNRFWKILSILFNCNLNNIEVKTKFLINNNIALFDVLKSCKISNSSDATITDIQVNDLSNILHNSNIKTIFTTGKKAFELYNRYLFSQTNIKAIYLPSPSPANCAFSLDKLVDKYKIIKEYL